MSVVIEAIDTALSIAIVATERRCKSPTEALTNRLLEALVKLPPTVPVPPSREVIAASAKLFFTSAPVVLGKRYSTAFGYPPFVKIVL